MRKTIGLCFLTATLLSASANAQTIFIEKGDPDAISATVGGGLAKDAWGAGVSAGYSYRGVFDVGLDFTRYAFTAGNNNKLAGYSIMPRLTWQVMENDIDDMPISLSFTLGIRRLFYTGNTPVANPEGWGTLVGASVYRRFEFGAAWVFIPEVFAAYDLSYTRYYSEALDQQSGNKFKSEPGVGYSTETKHTAVALIRPNLLFKAGNANYVITPYVGLNQNAFSVGGNVGALF